MRQKEKETIIPKPCACGKAAAMVRRRGGIMYSCPEPMRCKGNLRTRWCGHEQTAAAEWNSLVAEFYHAGGDR